MDELSTNPATRLRTFRAGSPESAEAGCPFLLVTSRLDKQTRSNSPSEGGRKLLLQNWQRPKPSHSHSIRQRQHTIVRTITAAAHREDRQLTGSEDGAEQAFQVAAEKCATGMAVFCAQRAVADMQLVAFLFDLDQGAQGRRADLLDGMVQIQLADLCVV